ncbi:uncharacterized protein LOC142773335 [Rhipicephalus microplus]|uniref:uncharacterized protein LOC142773335 n=1 Tax=Rhipicephalus microplus TaxID=6941 RepID=UPI003F6CBF84
MSEENDDGSAGKGACNVRVSVSESADDLWWPIEVACHDWATGDHYVAVGCVAGDEPEQRQTGDSGPKRQTQAIQVPARKRGCLRYCRPTTSWGGIASTSTASRGTAWPAVLFLAEGIADLGEASPWSAVRHSDERGLANGHGCVEHRVSVHALRWTGWPFPAWSIASPMQVYSVVAPMSTSAGVTTPSHIGKRRARRSAGRDAGVRTEDHGAVQDPGWPRIQVPGEFWLNRGSLRGAEPYRATRQTRTRA